MFLLLDSKICIFVGKKIIIHTQPCAQMRGEVACKPGLQASAIRKMSFHADHPPMCLKMLCKCTKIWYCNAALCKKVRHYFRHYFVLFTFNSMLSFLFYYVNLPKGGLLVNLCFYINWLTRICVCNLTIIGSDNCLSPGRRHAIIWTDAGILLIGPSKTDFNEIIHFHSRKFENVPW